MLRSDTGDEDPTPSVAEAKEQQEDDRERVDNGLKGGEYGDPEGPLEPTVLVVIGRTRGVGGVDSVHELSWVFTESLLEGRLGLCGPSKGAAASYDEEDMQKSYSLEDEC